MNEALKGAWDALTEEERAAWDEKYGERLAELGVDREKHDMEQKEKAAKSPSAKKAPKDALKMFIDEEFFATYKEENPESKKGSKECVAAAKEAFEALSEEVRQEWQTKWQAVVDSMPAEAQDSPSKSKKPKKPKKGTAR